MIVTPYFIFNLRTQSMFSPEGFRTLEAATDYCKECNEAMKEQYRTLIVIHLQDAYYTAITEDGRKN